ncbi:MAG TPA: type I-MYXAN CRISPR-associated protein Cas6/Cmx6 [Gemmataceae bacterium]|nr:type I-MYXAN CRISPR-associated protein Cas6/Cmx6 [Gemmataceae bacterium]
MIDLSFPVRGETLPTDHAYALYGALARAVPALHGGGLRLLLASIPGEYVGGGQLRLVAPRSRLRLRLPAEAISAALPLAGKALNVAGHTVRLGVPQVLPLVPAAALVARLVTMKRSDRREPSGTKRYMDPAAFLGAARRQLEALGIRGEPAIPLISQGPHAGKPRRRVLRIKERRVVGYALQVTGLTAAESIRLQEHGLGGRTRMGCGFFVPLRCKGDRHGV